MNRTVASMLSGLALLLPMFGVHNVVHAAGKEVTIAYQDMMVPWRYAQSIDELAKTTGYKVSYRKFAGGGDVIRAMASGNVQIGEAGSSPVASGLSQGLPSSCSGSSTTSTMPKRWWPARAATWPAWPT